MRVPRQLPFTDECDKPGLALSHNRGKSTENSHIACGVWLELSWGARSDSRSQTFAERVGHSLQERIGAETV